MKSKLWHLQLEMLRRLFYINIEVLATVGCCIFMLIPCDSSWLRILHSRLFHLRRCQTAGMITNLIFSAYFGLVKNGRSTAFKDLYKTNYTTSARRILFRENLKVPTERPWNMQSFGTIWFVPHFCSKNILGSLFLLTFLVRRESIQIEYKNKDTNSIWSHLQ